MGKKGRKPPATGSGPRRFWGLLAKSRFFLFCDPDHILDLAKKKKRLASKKKPRKGARKEARP
ncbi:hypothetical protein EG19_10660 [Thermoanaerobaculum aquaticum]|uniref:Uncharacterized protein n=1 Tax=Thermoanaerobaculum aquaticum TaxID=1312852 RepID=A0A062XYU8_9BACT|nr:hypothetical protein EG19_10660 [Thermoanaerobaculum aquaticum]